MEVEVGFGKTIPVAQLRSHFAQIGIKEISIQALKGGEKEFLLRLGKEATESIKDPTDHKTAEEAVVAKNAESGGAKVQALQSIIAKEFAEFEPKINRIDYVGPQIG